MKERLKTRQLLPEDEFFVDPSKIMTDSGLTPDPWQKELLESTCNRILALATRQSGKSTGCCALVANTAIVEAPALCLILAPTERQSIEVLQTKVLPRLIDAGQKVQAAKTSLELANGSRIIALPDNEAGIRCYSDVNLLFFDEASRIPDILFNAASPMLAVSKGRILAATTPYGKRGWFYNQWEKGGTAWQRFKITADQCPRISPKFVEQQRRTMGPRWVEQEFFCQFIDSVDAVFREEDIVAAIRPEVKPFFPQRA